MNAESRITSKLIAPCGMDCGLCMAFLREKNRCPSCLGPDTDKRITCVRCKIKKCSHIKGCKPAFCFICSEYPCDILAHLDKRYRLKYGMSMIENLEYIKKKGIRDFVLKENIKWACPECGGVICVHKHNCSVCGKAI